jgi:hypothetical protein
MTFKEFQRLGYELSEKDMKIYEREIIRNYENAYRDIRKRIEDLYLTKLSDIAPTDYYNEMLKRNRLESLLSQITADYTAYAKASGKATIKALQVGFTENYYRQQFTTSWSEAVRKFTVLPDSLIELATVGTDKSFKAVSDAVVKKFNDKPFYMPQTGSISALLNDNAKFATEAIRRDIISGLRNGQGYQKTAAAVKKSIGFKYKQDGVDKIAGAMAKAVRVVRTEGNRVLNAASFANSMQLESQGVEVYKQWLATLDMNTRDRHQHLDGQKRAVDEPFDSEGSTAMYPGEFPTADMNINCRCSSNTIVPGLEPDIRLGRNPATGKNEVFSYKNYDEWIKDKV